MPSQQHSKAVSKGGLSDARVTLIISAEKYIQKIADKHPSKVIQRSVVEARKILDKVKASAANAAELSKDTSGNQSKQLNKALRLMNEDLNNLIVYIQSIDLKKQKEEKPVSQMLKVRNEEIKNSDKQMMNLMTEHQRLQARLNEVNIYFVIGFRCQIQLI
jgi:hypothetical protein